MSENATVQIPKDILTPIVNAHLSQALAEAMGAKGDVLAAAVSRVLNSKVDVGTGQASTSTYNTTTFSEWLVAKTFREAATEAFKESAKDYKEALKVEFAKQLGASKSKLSKMIAEAMAKRFDDMTCDHRLKVEVTIEEVKRDY